MRMPRSGEMGPQHVVILGAGFGGLYAARALRRARVRVTLIDQRNHHLFAPAAVQEGRHAAQNVVRSLRGEAHTPFRYVDKGSLATIGRAAGVADLMGLRLSGLIAWLAWLAIHIFFLIGFRNRIFATLNWAYSYLTFRRAARLITAAPPWPPGIGVESARSPGSSTKEEPPRGRNNGRAQSEESTEVR